MSDTPDSYKPENQLGDRLDVKFSALSSNIFECLKHVTTLSSASLLFTLGFLVNNSKLNSNFQYAIWAFVVSLVLSSAGMFLATIFRSTDQSHIGMVKEKEVFTFSFVGSVASYVLALLYMASGYKS